MVVDEAIREDFINRKGRTTQNVIVVCDFNMRFMYIVAGTEGSTHDMRVIKMARADPTYLHPLADLSTLVAFIVLLMQQLSSVAC